MPEQSLWGNAKYSDTTAIDLAIITCQISPSLDTEGLTVTKQAIVTTQNNFDIFNADTGHGL